MIDDAAHDATRRDALVDPLNGEETGLSHTTIRRMWTAFGLQSHRSETFKLSTDPQFVDKVRDIVVLYLSPPNRALVLCIDEKSQNQALDREQPVLPMMPGVPERRTHNYVRHGTTSLFAALDVASGFVIGKCNKRHRATEFLNLLKEIDAQIPDDAGLLLARIEAKMPARDLARRLLARELARLPVGETIRPIAIDTRPDRRPAPGPRLSRADFAHEGSLFRINIGARDNADPRWLLPLICRRGNVTRREVGAIRIGPSETTFEIAGEAADAYAQAASETDPRAPHVRISRGNTSTAPSSGARASAASGFKTGSASSARAAHSRHSGGGPVGGRLGPPRSPAGPARAPHAPRSAGGPKGGNAPPRRRP